MPTSNDVTPPGPWRRRRLVRNRVMLTAVTFVVTLGVAAASVLVAGAAERVALDIEVSTLVIDEGAAPAPLPADRNPPAVVLCATAAPSALGYDPFYVQRCDAWGISVLASGAVDPAALRVAANVMNDMIGHRHDLVAEMIRQGTRVGILDTDEVTSDLPEYRNIYALFPGVDWDTRARGLGATPFIPLSSADEQNLLCHPTDPYRGESIMVHEFAHTIRIMGVAFVAADLDRRIDDAYLGAMARGRWSNTYAATNSDEYFAEIVQSYFDTNIVGPVGGDGVHNDVATRTKLRVYDPQGFAIIDELFGAAPPLDLCSWD